MDKIITKKTWPIQQYFINILFNLKFYMVKCIIIYRVM